MHRFQHLWVWLMRIGYCRGFGIQSPTAYAFVRYVVNEHYPYYAYDELSEALPHLTALERKLGELYFRIANNRQADTWVSLQPSSAADQRYVERGCRATRYLSVRSIEDVLAADVHRLDVVQLSPLGNYTTFYREIADRIHPASVLIVEGIQRDAAIRRFWKEVQEDEHTTATFDLYYCGIAFFDKTRPKQHYKINF